MVGGKQNKQVDPVFGLDITRQQHNGTCRMEQGIKLEGIRFQQSKTCFNIFDLGGWCIA